MTATVLTGGAALLVLTALGLAVLAPMRAGRRHALLPAAPVLGAALLAVVMSTTSWWLSARWGLVLAVVAAAVLVVLAAMHGGRPWTYPGRTIWLAALVLGLGAVGAAVALLPNLWAGDGRAMSPNGSHDIYYYLAESTWLLDHPISPGPEIGAIPGTGNATPADIPMRAALDIPLRIGQPMVQAALMAATGRVPIDAIMVLTALWVLLVAPATFVAARLLRVRVGAATAVAAVTATSALLLQQAYQQNVDALLGVSLALLTLAACVAAAERRAPVPLAALLLTALMAVYTEYALFVGPAVVVGVLIRRRARPLALRRGAAVLGLAVALAPTAWVRAAGVLGVDRDADTASSPLADDGWRLAVSRFVGAAPLTGHSPSRTAVVLVTLLVLGWAGAVLLDRYRWMWLALLTIGLGYLAYATVDGRGYTQLRSASLLQPLLILLAGVGWAAVLTRLRSPAGNGAWTRWTANGAFRPVVAGLVVATSVVVAVNVRSAASGLDREYAVSRHVDTTYDEVGLWVDENGGLDGRDVTALLPDLFSQIWVAGELRDEPGVAYPALRPDYLGRTSYWGGEADPFLLLGPGAHADGPTGSVVAENARFRLVDLQAGPVVAASPMELPSWWPAAGPRGEMSGPDLGVVLVLRSPDAGTPVLELAATGSEKLEVLLTVAETGATSRATIDDDGTAVAVDIGDLRSATVTVDIAGDGVASPDTFTLLGVRNGP
jgi:hypothetical protein